MGEPKGFRWWLAGWLWLHLLQRVTFKRDPDLIIGAGNPQGPYMFRWWLTPWRRWGEGTPEAQRTRAQRLAVRLARLLPNLYLHEFQRDDDDRALHDHPSWAVSFMLHGGYIEHTIAAGGVHHRRQYNAGALRILRASHVHRIELLRTPHGVPIRCWTLYLFGPTLHSWGFHCPTGWVPWRQFTAENSPGEIGPGCGA